jgi:hypothetical protein
MKSSFSFVDYSDNLAVSLIQAVVVAVVQLALLETVSLL